MSNLDKLKRANLYEQTLNHPSSKSTALAVTRFIHTLLGFFVRNGLESPVKPDRSTGIQSGIGEASLRNCRRPNR